VRSILSLFVALLCLVPAPAAAVQDNVALELDRAKALYQEGRLDQAVSALRAVISKLNELKDVQNSKIPLAEAHLHLALAYFALRDETAALDNFRRVVTLDPTRELDPDIYSPRVIEAIDRARAEVLADGARKASAPAAARPADAPRAPLGEASRPAARKPQVLPGARLRVALDGRDDRFEGTLLAVDERSFTLGVSNQSIGLERARITKLEVVTREKSHWLAGLIIGTATGALIGAAEQPGCDQNECYTRAENIGYGAAGAGLIGALIGAFIRTDQWAEVPVDNLAIGVSDRRISVSLTWHR
jgi:hypothetical protein